MERLVEFKGAGTTLSVSDILAQYLQVDTINIEVTADRARNIILPNYATLVNINLKINIKDKTGGAGSNNITIQTFGSPDTINGLSAVTINTANGSAQITGCTSNLTKQWISNFAGAASSSTGGGGGGGTSDILTFDITYPAARIIQLLNDANDSEQVVAPVAGNKIIQMVLGTAKARILFGTTVYNNDDARLLLANAATNPAFPLGAIPPNILSQNYGDFGWDFIPLVALRPTDQYYAISASGVGGGIFLRSNGNGGFPVTQGDSPVRVFGSYYVKTLS